MLENYTCSFCNKEPPTFACICDSEIKLIGSNCQQHHSSDSSVLHEPLDIHLAIKLQSNPRSYEEYLERTMKVSEVMNRLKIINNRVKSYTKQLESAKSKLIRELDPIFTQAISRYDPILEEIKYKMRLMTQYKQNLCSEGKELMNKYTVEGDAGLFNGFIDRIDICIEEITEMVKERLSLEYNPYKKFKEEEENPGESQEVAYFKMLINQKNMEIKKCAQARLNLEAEVARKNQKINSLSQGFDMCKEKLLKLIKELNSLKHDLLHDLNSTQLNIESEVYQYLSDNKSNLSHIPRQSMKYALEDDLIAIESCSQESSDSSIEITVPSIIPFTKNFIYTQNIKGLDFTQFDIPNDKMRYIPIGQLKDELHKVAICQLSTDTLFITNFINSKYSRTYLFQVSTGIWNRLQGLPKARHSVSLCYHNNKVYAFGGIRFKAPVEYADVFDLDSKSWIMLPDMHFERDSISSVAVGNRIYLFSGKSSYIDVLYVESMKFKVKTFDNCERYDSNLAVASFYDDKIYLISHSYIQVYDKDLTRLFFKSLDYEQDHYTHYDIVNYDGKIYYYNTINQAIEFIDTDLSQISNNQVVTRLKPSLEFYKIREKTKEIHRIHVKNGTLEVYNLDIPRNFNNTNLCTLPDGTLLIAGFYSSVGVNGAAFIYDPMNNMIEKLPDLNIPRAFIGLISTRACAYAFGGKDRNGDNMISAERFDILNRKWIKMGDMRVARSLPQCIEVDNIIYIMGGKEFSIECYNPTLHYYRILNDISLIDDYGIVKCIDDKIYYVGSSSYQIFSKDFREIQRGEKKWNSPKSMYCLGNSDVYRGKIYYFNQSFETLETFDIHILDKGIFSIKVT
jgi:hypothetical protein